MNHHHGIQQQQEPPPQNDNHDDIDIEMEIKGNDHLDLILSKPNNHSNRPNHSSSSSTTTTDDLLVLQATTRLWMQENPVLVGRTQFLSWQQQSQLCHEIANLIQHATTTYRPQEEQTNPNCHDCYLQQEQRQHGPKHARLSSCSYELEDEHKNRSKYRYHDQDQDRAQNEEESFPARHDRELTTINTSQSSSLLETVADVMADNGPENPPPPRQVRTIPSSEHCYYSPMRMEIENTELEKHPPIQRTSTMTTTGIEEAGSQKRHQPYYRQGEVNSVSSLVLPSSPSSHQERNPLSLARRTRATAAVVTPNSNTIGLLDLPQEVLIRILSMLPTLHDILQLRRVCKSFDFSWTCEKWMGSACGGCRCSTNCNSTPTSFRTTDIQRFTRPPVIMRRRSLLESVLQERQRLLRIPHNNRNHNHNRNYNRNRNNHKNNKKQQRQQPQPQFPFAPSLSLQWILELQPLEDVGFLVPGHYQLFNATRDHGRLFSYSATGTITLHPDGTCTGYAREQCPPLLVVGEEGVGNDDDHNDNENHNNNHNDNNRTILSAIQKGRWTWQSLQFQYVYGHHLYVYVLQLVSVVETCLRRRRRQPPPPSTTTTTTTIQHHPQDPSPPFQQQQHFQEQQPPPPAHHRTEGDVEEMEYSPSPFHNPGENDSPAAVRVRRPSSTTTTHRPPALPSPVTKMIRSSSTEAAAGLPTAVLRGTWDSCHPDADPSTEHGVVDQMLIVGPGLGVSQKILSYHA